MSGETSRAARRRRPPSLLTLALLIVVAAVSLFVWVFQDTPALNRSVLAWRSVMDPARIAPDEGHAFVYPSRWFGAGDDVDHPHSSIVLHEDGVELTQSRAKHDDIRAEAGGRWSHWTTSIFFSASDGSDPRTNGRRYVIQGLTLPVRWGAGLLAALASALAVVTAVRILRSPRLSGSGAAAGGTAESGTASGSGSGSASAPRSPARRAALVAATLAVTLLILGGCLAALELILRLSAHLDHEAKLALVPRLGWDRADPTPRPFGDVASLSGAAPPLKVLFMGDSFTHDKTWGSRTIEHLRAAGIPAVGWEVGVEGYGTVQETLKLAKLLPELKPDVVVILFYAWNDPRDNFAYPAICYNPQTTTRPYLDDRGEVREPSRVKIWLKSLELWKQLVEPTIDGTRVRTGKEAIASMGVDGIAMARLALVVSYDTGETWRALYDPAMQKGAYVTECWKATRAAFTQARALCRDAGVALIVAAVDNPFTVDADVAAKELAGSTLDPQLPLTHWKEIMDELGIPSFNSQPGLAARSKAQGGVKQYDGGVGNLAGHLVPDAEEVIAEGVAPKIIDAKRARDAGPASATPPTPTPAPAAAPTAPR